MTAEERAKRVKGTFLPDPDKCLELQANIAAAITAAEEAEREACAKVAEDSPGPALSSTRAHENMDIAAAIRARGKK